MVGGIVNRYMKCETITGEWWYKDLQTGEDLPKYATPIIGLEEKHEILTRWQDPTIEEYKKEIDRLNNLNKQLVEECQRLDDEETRLNNIIDELEKYIKTEVKIELYKDKNGFRTFADSDDILNKLKELKENNK